MNDFTKEELECARDALELWNSKHICSGMSNLNLKIQSMIDNYCEHEKATTIHPGDTVLICNQCETILSPWNLRKYQP